MMKQEEKKKVRLAILDANMITLIQPNGPFSYLEQIADLEMVPPRKAREETDDSGKNHHTPLSPDRDAPAPMKTNTSNRRTNDPAVLVGPTRGSVDARRIAETVYPNSTTNKHLSDQEIMGSAIELYESAPSKYEYVCLVSADQDFCKKAQQYLAQMNISIEVLHARVPSAKAISGIKTVQQVFVP